MSQYVRVWAPLCDTVELQLEPSHERIPMQRETPHSPVFVSPSALDAGQRYFLVPHSVDSANTSSADTPQPFAVPDPRSRRQPLGIHGPSEIIDPASFAWHDDEWLSSSAAKESLAGKVFYEMHIGTFSQAGTFEGAIEHLDHLVQLGIDVIELLPISPMPGARGWGYDGVSLMAPYEEYGGPAGLVALVNAAHTRGIAVCLDVVFNHFGPDGNYVGFFGSYTSSAHQTPWGGALHLDGEGSEYVRAFVIDAMQQWVRDYHIDCFRMDAVDWLIDTSTQHILADITDCMRELSRKLGRTITVIGESDANYSSYTAPTPAQGGSSDGRGLTMQWIDDVHHALHVWLTGEHQAYYSEYTDDKVLETAFTRGMWHTGQWDEFLGRPRGAVVPDDLHGHRFMVFDENHDQVGNRLIGDRPSAHLRYGQMALSRALIILSPFTPMLFMGEEWGTAQPFMYFTDHAEHLGSMIAQGRAQEFAGWNLESMYGSPVPNVPDPQALETFTGSRLAWNELELSEHQRFLEFTKALIALRKNCADIASGNRSRTHVQMSPSYTGGWMQRGEAIIVFTKNEQGETITAPVTGKRLALTWDPVTVNECRHNSEYSIHSTDAHIDYDESRMMNVSFSSSGIAVFLL